MPLAYGGRGGERWQQAGFGAEKLQSQVGGTWEVSRPRCLGFSLGTSGRAVAERGGTEWCRVPASSPGRDSGDPGLAQPPEGEVPGALWPRTCKVQCLGSRCPRRGGRVLCRHPPRARAVSWTCRSWQGTGRMGALLCLGGPGLFLCLPLDCLSSGSSNGWPQGLDPADGLGKGPPHRYKQIIFSTGIEARAFALSCTELGNPFLLFETGPH